MRSYGKRLTVFVVGACALGLGVSACGGSSAETSSNATSTTATAAVDTTIADQLPAKIRAAGVLKVASNVEYPPFEYFDTDNKTIIGLDRDLADVIGEKLGVELQFENIGFDTIIPSLEAKRYDMAMSAMTDNEERRQKVDFVDYFVSGGGFLVAKGNPNKIQALDDICGMSVAVDKGTTNVADAQDQSKKCEAAGKKAVDVQLFPGTNEIVLALQTGRVDLAMMDTSAGEYVAQQNAGKFEVPGKAYSPRPYGVVFPKGSQELAKAVAGALEAVVADGTYAKVLEKWGQTAGSVDKITINDGNGLS